MAQSRAAALGWGWGKSAASGSMGRAASPRSAAEIAGISTIESLGVRGRRIPDAGSPGTVIAPAHIAHLPNAPAIVAGTHIGAPQASQPMRIPGSEKSGLVPFSAILKMI